jgi:hypothetical protein
VYEISPAPAFDDPESGSNSRTAESRHTPSQLHQKHAARLAFAMLHGPKSLVPATFAQLLAWEVPNATFLPPSFGESQNSTRIQSTKLQPCEATKSVPLEPSLPNLVESRSRAWRLGRISPTAVLMFLSKKSSSVAAHGLKIAAEQRRQKRSRYRPPRPGEELRIGVCRYLKRALWCVALAKVQTLGHRGPCPSKCYAHTDSILDGNRCSQRRLVTTADMKEC